MPTIINLARSDTMMHAKDTHVCLMNFTIANHAGSMTQFSFESCNSISYIQDRVNTLRDNVHKELSAKRETTAHERLATSLVSDKILSKISRAGYLLMQDLLPEKAQNILANSCSDSSGAILAVQDARAAQIPWELLYFGEKHGKYFLGSRMIVTRVCEQDEWDPESANVESIHTDRMKGIYTGIVPDFDKSGARYLARVGFLQVTNSDEYEAAVSDGKAVAILCKTTHYQRGKSNSVQSRQKTGIVIKESKKKIDSIIYSLDDIQARKHTKNSLIVLIGCAAGASGIAREIVKYTGCTVIATDFDIPIKGAVYFCRRIIRVMNELSEPVPLVSIWLDDKYKLGLLQKFFTVHGNWDILIGGHSSD